MNSPSEFQSPFHGTELTDLLSTILSIVMYVLFPVVVIMVMYTGFLFVTAKGNPQKIQQARTALMWTVIGGLVVLGARAFSLMVESTVTSLT